MSVEHARAAIREYLEQVVIDGDNPDGEPLRDALFASRDASERERFTTQLRRAADLWGPGAPEWRSMSLGGGGTIYAGRVLQLYTEVRIDPAGRVAATTVALD